MDVVSSNNIHSRTRYLVPKEHRICIVNLVNHHLYECCLHHLHHIKQNRHSRPSYPPLVWKGALNSTRSDRGSRATVQASTRTDSLKLCQVEALNARAGDAQGSLESCQSGSNLGSLSSVQAEDVLSFKGGEGGGVAERVRGNILGGDGAIGELLRRECVVGVDLSHVATNLKHLWDRLGKVENIGLEIWDGILVGSVTGIPVIRDTLVTGDPLEVVLRALDGHEGLENFFVQDALRVFSGFVGHEAVDEGVGGLRNFNTGERVVGEVGVAGDGLLEALGAEGAEDFKVVIGSRGVGLHVVELIELAHEQLVVVAVL